MSDEYHKDIVTAAKSNPKALFGVFTCITLSCIGLLITALFDTSVLVAVIGWTMVIVGIALSWGPMQKLLAVQKGKR